MCYVNSQFFLQPKNQPSTPISPLYLWTYVDVSVAVWYSIVDIRVDSAGIALLLVRNANINFFSPCFTAICWWWQHCKILPLWCGRTQRTSSVWPLHCFCESPSPEWSPPKICPEHTAEPEYCQTTAQEILATTRHDDNHHEYSKWFHCKPSS